VHIHTYVRKSFYDHSFVIVLMGHNHVKLHVIVLQFHIKTKRKTALLQLRNIDAYHTYCVHVCICAISQTQMHFTDHSMLCTGYIKLYSSMYTHETTCKHWYRYAPNPLSPNWDLNLFTLMCINLASTKFSDFLVFLLNLVLAKPAKCMVIWLHEFTNS